MLTILHMTNYSDLALLSTIVAPHVDINLQTQVIHILTLREINVYTEYYYPVYEYTADKQNNRST